MGFRWRGGEVSRLEGFSDAVFGFAVTLLVVSVEVPHSFAELARVMRGFVAFALCFALLLGVWERHYRFFRRYGLQDRMTVALNGLLLFVVVFYVYPLKFLFGAIVDGLFWGRPLTLAEPDARALFAIYGAGFAAIFACLTVLYAHVSRHREALELNRLELALTHLEIKRNALLVGLGSLSIVSAALLPPNRLSLAGFVYMLVGAIETWHGARSGAARRTLAEPALPPAPDPT